MFKNASSLEAGRKRVFNSVFAPISLKEHASVPETTGTVGQQKGKRAVSRRAQSNKPASSDSDKSINRAPDDQPPVTTTLDREWHLATDYLRLPDCSINDLPGSSDLADHVVLSPEHLASPPLRPEPSRETYQALAHLLSTSFRSIALDQKKYDLIDWYQNEIRRHFIANFRSGLMVIIRETEPKGAVFRVVNYLRLVQNLYYTPFLNLLSEHLEHSASVFTKLRETFQAAVAYSLPSEQISTLLTAALADRLVVILGIAHDESAMDVEDDSMDIDVQLPISYQTWRDESQEVNCDQLMTDHYSRVHEIRRELWSLLEALQDVGLGGERAQQVFAGVMNDMITRFIITSYSEQWDSPSLTDKHLRSWIENVFARLVFDVLEILQPSGFDGVNGRMNVRFDDVARWQEIAICRLGALRTSELFDVIVEWDMSSGAIEDLKRYATHPAARYSVTTAFISMLNQRLLHPGASTVQILQLYISIIRAFSLLDPKGVLLDRIARPIRKYLRDRDDTIKAIVTGLLSEPSESGTHAGGSGETLAELSTELSNAHQRSLQNDSSELDWNDMNWMPDPIDAAADYKKSKGSDVISSLISLFESKEAFVKELQEMLSERLLKKKTDFDQELSVLELLKVRFGDGALQACEVMLRDVFDSKRVDAVIRNDQGLASRQPAHGEEVPSSDMEQPHDMPQFHTKILSRFFWPAIQDQPFKVPPEISALQERYAAGFESLKQSRRLTWLNGLGQVTVELDLEDRVFTDEVTTWQATVIYAFDTGPTTDTTAAAVTKTVSELASSLEMPASLVRSACLFWVSKRILTEDQRDVFRVLERLPQDEDRGHDPTGEAASTGPSSGFADDADDAAAAAADEAAATAAKETAHAAAMEKMNLYWQFIMGMLTNQGAMPLQRIIMMLKLTVPGGFPFGNEELREFLAGMVAEGKLEIVGGGSYKLVR